MKRPKLLLGSLILILAATLLVLAVNFMIRPPHEVQSTKATAGSPLANGMHTEAADAAASATSAVQASVRPSTLVPPVVSTTSSSVSPAVNSPVVPGIRSSVLPVSSTPTARWVSAEAAASLGLVPDPNSGPAWPAGFTLYRTPAEILAGKDLSDPDVRAQVVKEMTTAEDIRYAAVLAKAKQLDIPVRIEGPGHNVAILHDFRGDEPLYRTTLNTNAAITTGANLLNQMPYNLNGENMVAGVWDGGRARMDHVELAGKVTIGDPITNTNNDDHATHVAGTIAARGVNPKAKGMGIYTSIHSYDWFNDFAEMTAAGAATALSFSQLPVSNHSYGIKDPATSDKGRYGALARDLDAVANGLSFYQVFWAAGNEQVELGGYQSITFYGLAKNVVTVGAVSMAVNNGIRDPSMAALAYFSSMGPCDDGRIKPDVVADGVDVFSSVATTPSSYDTYSGTSMATPNTTGSSVLLEQLYRNSFGQVMRASMLKALLVHTADDLGRPGPDYQYGWGLVNVRAAADVIAAHAANPGQQRLVEGTNSTGGGRVQVYSYVFDGTRPIRATLVWTDPPGVAQTAVHSRTRNLIHDLDLKVTAPNGDDYLPYVMPFVGTWTPASMTANAVTGTNTVDNVERVDIAMPPQAGTYKVTVGMYGTNALTTTGQAYSLVVSEVPKVATAPPVITSPATASGSVGAVFNYQITADNGPDSFGATGLPAGLSVNASTGLISGLPLAIGTFSVTLSASNSKGVGTKVLSITIAPGGSVLLWEDFSTVTKGSSAVVGGAILAWFGNANFPTVRRAYQSGGSVQIGNGLETGSLTTKALNLSGGGGVFTIGFKVKGWTKVEGDIKVSVTGLPPRTISFGNTMTGGFETKTLSFTGGQPNSTITIATTAKRAFLDDIVVVSAEEEEEPSAQTYSSWVSVNYPQRTGDDALPEADPDGNGFSNLMEYYMGLNLLPVEERHVRVVSEGGNASALSMTYRRAKNTVGVTGSVGWSSSLDSGTWSTNGVTEVAVDMGSYEQVTATVTNAPGDTQKFLRLKVQQP